jgi:hypothetical protein
MTVRAVVVGLMIGSALSFLCASLLHFGVTISIFGHRIHDPFLGAAIPAMVIAIVMGIGSAIVLKRHRVSWVVALSAISLALLGVIYGLTVTLQGGRIGDITYHFSVLALLLIALILLLVPKTRGQLGPKA